jgi:hypothetical protein
MNITDLTVIAVVTAVVILAVVLVFLKSTAKIL